MSPYRQGYVVGYIEALQDALKDVGRRPAPIDFEWLRKATLEDEERFEEGYERGYERAYWWKHA